MHLPPQDLREYLDCLGYASAPFAREGEKIEAPTPESAPQNSYEAEATRKTEELKATEAPQEKLIPWCFILDKATQSNPDALQLFSKMLSALKLADSSIESHFVTNSEELESFLSKGQPGQRVVILGSKLNINEAHFPFPVYRSFSPAECLNDASRKRPVWDILQKAQKGR